MCLAAASSILHSQYQPVKPGDKATSHAAAAGDRNPSRKRAAGTIADRPQPAGRMLDGVAALVRQIQRLTRVL